MSRSGCSPELAWTGLDPISAFAGAAAVSPTPKMLLVPVGQINSRSPPVSRSSGGADASSRTWNAGCDGRKLYRPTSDAVCGRRSRVVLAPRRWRQQGTTLARCTGDGTRKPDHQREHEGNRNSIAQGMPALSGEPVVTNLRAFLPCTQGFGCALLWIPDLRLPRKIAPLFCRDALLDAR